MTIKNVHDILKIIIFSHHSYHVGVYLEGILVKYNKAVDEWFISLCGRKHANRNVFIAHTHTIHVITLPDRLILFIAM